MNKDLFDYTLHLADNSLVMGHRLSEWTGHGPMIEQDIAITNIALDLIGQSRNFYQYAATLKGGTTEDSLAYLRDSREFKNLLIAETSNGDWAKTITKLFFFSAYQFYLYQQLISSADAQLAAIAEKSLKEVTYHVRWSGDWVIRLGDGTEGSKSRMEKAIENIWPLTGEMLEPAIYEKALLENRISVNVSKLKDAWLEKVETIFDEATLHMPKDDIWMQSGGKIGIHSEELGHILAEMQFLQRTYPGCEW
jgi:ring-1,2-phenylacetyl-CoA epoxidase subunit PaaC